MSRHLYPATDSVPEFLTTYPITRLQQRQRASLGEAVLHDDGALWALQQQVAEARFSILSEAVRTGRRLMDEPTVRIIIEVEQDAISDNVPEGLALDSRQRRMGVRRLEARRCWFDITGYDADNKDEATQ